MCGPGDATYDVLCRLRAEYVVALSGTVRARSAVNDKIATGRIEARPAAPPLHFHKVRVKVHVKCTHATFFFRSQSERFLPLGTA